MTIVPGRRARADRGAAVARASGLVVGLAGAGLVGVGLWGQREVRTALARERIVSTPDAKPPSAPVRSGAAARSMAEAIRRRTVEAAGGRTYSQVGAYLDEEGNGTTDSAAALVDERKGASRTSAPRAPGAIDDVADGADAGVRLVEDRDAHGGARRSARRRRSRPRRRRLGPSIETFKNRR